MMVLYKILWKIKWSISEN